MSQLPGSDRRSNFMVERYEPGLTLEQLRQSEPDIRAAADAVTSDGHEVRYVGSTLIPAEETAFYAFAAEAARWVGEAVRRAGLPCDRIVAVVESRESAPRRSPDADASRASRSAGDGEPVARA